MTPVFPLRQACAWLLSLSAALVAPSLLAANAATTTTSAASASAPPATSAGGDAQARLQAFRAAGEPASMRFVQMLRSAQGDVLERQEGRLEILPPDRFLWRYESPYEAEYGSNGTLVWHWDQELAQITVRDARQTLAGTPLALLLDVQADLPVAADPDGWLSWEPQGDQAQFARLRAFRFQPLGIVDGVAHPIEQHEAIGARRHQRLDHHRHESGAARHLRHARFLGEIVEPQHEARQSRNPRRLRNPLQREHGLRRLDHHPQLHGRIIACAVHRD